MTSYNKRGCGFHLDDEVRSRLVVPDETDHPVVRWLAPAIQLALGGVGRYVTEWLGVHDAIIHHLLVSGLEDAQGTSESGEEVWPKDEQGKPDMFMVTLQWDHA